MDRVEATLSEGPGVLPEQFSDVLPGDHHPFVVCCADGNDAKSSTWAGVRSSYDSMR